MEKSGAPQSAGLLPGAALVAVAAVGRSAGVEGEDTAGTAVSSRLFCCVCVRNWIPLAYREELYHVLRLTGPLLVSRILIFLLPFVITIFCGHLGNAELAGYALGSAVISVSTTATGYGLSSACDTLVSQTFGRKNLKRVGVIIQRGILILLLFCLPCWALLINTQNILLAMHQQEEVARIAHLYVMAYLPAVPAMFMHQLQVAYLQNQGIILPQMYTAAAANLINLGVNYVLLFSLKMGVIGSAIANSLSQIYLCLLLFTYIHWRGLHKKTWEGWSSASLQEWGSYMQLAIPSTLMICFEWWILEIGSFLAGRLGEVDLAAQHVLMELGAITYMFPLGVHAAACVRVGNALGAGDTSRATCKVALGLSGALAVFQGVAIFILRNVLGYIFTTDVNIVEIVSENLSLHTFTQFFDALLCVCSGILVGAGKQKIAALSNLLSYYCIALPVGIALMFAANLRILGFWIGLFICVVIQTSFFITLIFKLNWQRATEEAQVRAGKVGPVTCVPAKSPIGPPVTDTLIPEGSECFQPTLNSNMAQSEGEGPRPVGYTPAQVRAGKVGPVTCVPAKSPIGPPVTDTLIPEGSECFQPTLNSNMAQSEGEGPRPVGYTPVSTQGAGEKQRLGECERGTEGGGETPIVETNALLSTTQLILRRGLTLLATLLLLATGVAVHLACPPPEPSVHSRSNLTLDWANHSTTLPATPWLDLTTPL